MRKILLSLLILLVFVPVEYYFASQAYYTSGWALHGLLLHVLWISILLSITFLALGFQKTALILLVSGFLLIVPFTLYDVNLWSRLKTESDEIVHWAYQVKSKTGTFPKVLTRKHDHRISYTKEKNDQFTLFFYVSTPSTGHFYTSKDGWGYMDD